MRISMITMAYANHRVFDASLAAYYHTTNRELVNDHVIVDQHYPLHRPQLLGVMNKWAGQLQAQVMDPGKNLGLHNGFNFAMQKLALGWAPDEFVIGYDPDECPITPGWVRAMFDVMTANASIGWLSLTSGSTDVDQKGFSYKDRQIAGHKVRFFDTAKMNIVCMWRTSMLRQVGWLDEPRPYYGLLESMMWPRLERLGWKTGYMMEFRNQQGAFLEKRRPRISGVQTRARRRGTPRVSRLFRPVPCTAIANRTLSMEDTRCKEITHVVP